MGVRRAAVSPFFRSGHAPPANRLADLRTEGRILVGSEMPLETPVISGITVGGIARRQAHR